MLNFQVEQLQRLRQQPDETWQGGLVRAPAWITGEDAEPYRPYLALWTAVRAGTVHTGRMVRPDERNLALAVDALVEFACDDETGGYRPGRIEVNDPALAEHLEGLLAEAGVKAVYVASLAALDGVLADMARHMTGREPGPSALEGEGVTLERMRAFAEAAADFYRAAPWQYLTDMDLIEIEQPAAPVGLRFATVLGAGGAAFGLGFYEAAEDYARFRSSTDFDELRRDLSHRLWHLTFGPITDLPTYDPDLWEDDLLPVAGAHAYPSAWSLGPSGQVKRPNAAELSFLEGVLRAIAQTTEQQIDSGRWRHGVATFDGSNGFILALPDLISPPTLKDLMDRGYPPDRRAMERGMVQMQRYFELHPAKSMDEMNVVMQRLFSGKTPDEIDAPPRTPLEEAQDLCYQAFDTRGRRCVQLAKKALEICPDCADAYVILAEHAAGAEAEHDYYARGVKAGERALGSETFEAEVGHFWGILETRPYMRARLGLAQTLEKLGRPDEAVEHYRNLLRLNPGDNQGVRYLLLPRLLELGHDAEAARYMKQAEDEPTANWSYTRAMLAYRLGGDSATARQELKKAVKINPFVIDSLRDDQPHPMPDSYSLGSREEAVICAEELRPAITATPGAMEWLQAQGRAAKPHGGPRRRRRKQKRR